MRSDLCVFILSHGRPDSMLTHDLLRSQGYTGEIFVVIDDEDETGPRYHERFGSNVLVFSKTEMSSTVDTMENRPNHRGVVYARNACWRLAKEVGFRYFMTFDDDCNTLGMRINEKGHYGWWPVRDLDSLFDSMIQYFETIPALSIALSQGGDHMGGASGRLGKSNMLLRKAMCSFLCSVDRPFEFPGRTNEDTNMYVSEGRRGALFFTIGRLQVNSGTTQKNAGGLTDLYRQFGTYEKSMYSVLISPSSVTVRPMGRTSMRLHHSVSWDSTAVKIVHERYRKPDSVEKVLR